MRRRKGLPISGWINLYKPRGLTSTAAVSKVKYLLKPQKIGHAGTLDPLGEGLLPLAFGEATKAIPYLQQAPKEYAFTIRWGVETTTDDAEGEARETSDSRPDAAAVAAALPQFTGRITQVPPAFSAIKIGGARAYDLARAGKAVEVPSREVDIFSFAHDPRPDDDADHMSFRTTCGSGTYVRALGRDLARALGTCGHVSRLERTRVGGFTTESAISLETLEEFSHKPEFGGIMLPIVKGLDDIPALHVTSQEAERLRRGQPLFHPAASGDVMVAMADDGPVAIVKTDERHVAVIRVFNAPPRAA
ncbi:MAG: tRNA pseudouridine(55) synthase TruB [Pseudomonadota bacterium]